MSMHHSFQLTLRGPRTKSRGRENVLILTVGISGATLYDPGLMQ